MTVEVPQTEPKTVVVSGEIDLFNVGELHQALDLVLSDSPPGVLLEMSNLTYIDSAGIAAIMGAYQRIRRTEGRLALVLVNRHIKEIFSLIHIDKLPGITIHEVVADAKRALAETA